MNYTFRLLFFLLICTSCTQEPSVTFSYEVFTEKDLAICKDEPCSRVDISYPVASGDIKISDKINTHIRQFISEVLFLGDEMEVPVRSIEQAAHDFIMAYRDHQVDIPSDIDPGGYDADVTIEIISERPEVISLKNDIYLFTGGAHGNSLTTFSNFNPKTGKLIYLEEMIPQFENFEAFVEDKFRKAQNIPEGENINYPGYWFEDDQFYLSTNIGFTNTELLIVYNTYEIAPYALGQISLAIALEEVEPYLNLAIL